MYYISQRVGIRVLLLCLLRVFVFVVVSAVSLPLPLFELLACYNESILMRVHAGRV